MKAALGGTVTSTRSLGTDSLLVRFLSSDGRRNGVQIRKDPSRPYRAIRKGDGVWLHCARYELLWTIQENRKARAEGTRELICGKDYDIPFRLVPCQQLVH